MINRQRDSVWLNEWDIYGNKRVGVVDTNLFVGTLPYSCSCTPPANPIDSSTIGYLEGEKQYELTNQLGNVLVTISDKKIAIDTNTPPPYLASYYEPCIINAQDYYPFGMIEPGREYAILGDSIYRYGYQGSMKDNDIYGKNNAYTTKNRELDDRVPRWWSIDPVPSPFWSPYVSMNDNPIWENDILGDVVQYGDPNGTSRKTRREVKRFVKREARHNADFRKTLKEEEGNKTQIYRYEATANPKEPAIKPSEGSPKVSRNEPLDVHTIIFNPYGNNLNKTQEGQGNTIATTNKDNIKDYSQRVNEYLSINPKGRVSIIPATNNSVEKENQISAITGVKDGDLADSYKKEREAILGDGIDGNRIHRSKLSIFNSNTTPPTGRVNFREKE